MSFFQRIKEKREKRRQGPTTEDLTKKMVLSMAKTRTFPTWSQWRHLPGALSRAERRTAFLALGVFFASSLFLVGRYAILHQNTIAATGGEYSEALIGQPQFVNPLYASVNDADADLARLIFSGLMKYDGQGGLAPDLAESYDVSDDGKTYTFVLRENVRWHNGDILTVSDVLGTVAMIQNPEYKSPLYGMFKDVELSQVDERTLQFTLKESFGPFLSALTVGIMPASVWDSIPPKGATLAKTNLEPVGTGPYQFSKYTKDQLGTILSYTLTRNPNYYGPQAHIERLLFRFYPDAITAVDALKKKAVDGVSYIPSEQRETLSRDRDVQLIFPSLHQYSAVFFNQVHQPVLKERKVRQALAMSVSKQQLVMDVLHERAKAIGGPILPGMIGYNESITGPTYDVEQAKRLLDEAGWKLAEGASVRTKDGAADGTKLTLTLTTIQDADFVAVANFLQKEWAQIGVETTLNIVDAETLQTGILKERSYDLLLTGELLGQDPDPYAFWHSSQVDYPGLNLALYANREADKLIDAGREQTDPATRTQSYQSFSQRLADDVPAIFLYQPTYTYAVGSNIKGVNIASILTPADRFNQVTDWYIKTRHVLK